MKNLVLALALTTLCGCVSFGARCTKSGTDAHYKVTRFGWGVSSKQVDNLSKFKLQVCPGY